MKRKKIITIALVALIVISLASISIDLLGGKALSNSSPEPCKTCGSSPIQQPSQETSSIYKIGSLSRNSAQEACGIMKPDSETLKKWVELYNEAPQAYIEPELKAELDSPGTFTLLDHLDYNPVERNQGSCGNCWAWAGTGVLEIALDVQRGIKDRLSVQYLTSGHNGGTGSSWACCGASLSDVAYFYSGTGYTIPWSNTNAHWQDGGQSCQDQATTVPFGTISNSPNYPISTCTAETIETHGVGQATAIANIKNILHQDRAVFFGYWLWDFTEGFRNFWWNEPEDAVWNPDFTCGQIMTDEGGGHAVLCVGYNNDDPDNSYWIMVNSWGTDGGDRPNGLFLMDMDMNYDCAFWDGAWYYSFYWETLDVTFTQSNRDIAVNALETPSVLPLGDSTIINGTIANWGLTDEVDVEVQFLVNGAISDTTFIPSLPSGTSTDVGFPWTPTIEDTYNVTIYAVPVSGEDTTSNNWLYAYTSVVSIPTVDVLIVSDDDGNSYISGTSSDDFATVLDTYGLSYFVWSEVSLSNPPLSILERFELVIWTCGDYFNEAVDETDAVTLQQYLTQGGSILIEGGDIGYDHDDDDLMANVAHAVYEVDDTGADGLAVTDPSHPVTADLPSSFLWDTNPPYADGVSPAAGGAEVIQYHNTAWSAVVVSGSGGSGSVVYMAFPFHCLDSPEQETLATNSVIWLLNLPPLYDLSDFPLPFIADTRIIIPISDSHGPCGGAHTMDTMGGILIANRLGIEGVTIETVMDSYSHISTYDYGTAKVTMTDTTYHLIVLASCGVNQVTYYYNELTDVTETHVLPVLFLRDAEGDYLYVQSTTNVYRIELDGSTVTADYGVIEIYRDGSRYVLIVYGLGGEASKAAAQVVAEYDVWGLTGQAVIVKYYDSDTDGYLDTIEIVETIP